MTDNKLLLMLCPPYWEKLPSPGIAYLCEYLRINNITVSFYDMNIRIYNNFTEGQTDWTINKDYTTMGFYNNCFIKYSNIFNEIINSIKNNRIKYVGFSVYKSNFEFCLRMARFLKEKTGIKIIFGGPEVFRLYMNNLFDDYTYIDNFVIGEGEKAIVDIIDRRKMNIFRFEQLEKIDFFPEYKNFELDLYKRKNAIPIIMSRGCINACKFCTERLLFKKYRVREPENVLEEIEFHYKQNNIKWFTFYDSVFNGDLVKLDRLMELIIKKGLSIMWDAQIVVRDDMDEELLDKMKTSGCVNLFVGLESGSNRILKLMGKRYNTEIVERFFQKLSNAGLNFEISLIVNYPNEMEKDIKETAEFIKSNSHLIKKIAQINPFKNYIGNTVEIDSNYDVNKGREKVDFILKAAVDSNIKFTRSYINNLI